MKRWSYFLARFSWLSLREIMTSREWTMFLINRCDRSVWDVSFVWDGCCGSCGLLLLHATRDQREDSGADRQGTAFKQVGSIFVWLKTHNNVRWHPETLMCVFLALFCRFNHSEECCCIISWRNTSPQYQRVHCQVSPSGWLILTGTDVKKKHDGFKLIVGFFSIALDIGIHVWYLCVFVFCDHVFCFAVIPAIKLALFGIETCLQHR